MRILLIGPAKTGNVWVQKILESVYQLTVIDPHLDTLEALETYVREGSFKDQTIFICHLPPEKDLLKILGTLPVHLVTVVRSPYDMLVSSYYFIQNIRPETIQSEDISKKIIGKPIDDPAVFDFIEKGFHWPMQLALQWIKSGESSVVRYERLHSQPLDEMRQLTDRIQPVDDQHLLKAIQSCDATTLRKLSPALAKHIRSATVGDWKNHLGEKHLALIKTCHADLITQLGYDVL